MVTAFDERNGVVKTNWKNIRKRVAEVEPNFAAIVDEISPDESFPLFLVYLPYGVLKGDTNSFYLPDGKGNYYQVTDSDAPKDISKYLGYGVGGSPMGMVLEKQFEYFIDLKNKGITVPWLVYSPGHFFPFSTILGCHSDHIYTPNGLLTVTSGARSTFMLPSIGCNAQHVNLKRDFNIQRQAPKSLYDHWHVFKDIIHSKKVVCDWRSCLIYFSEKWVVQIQNDPAWMKLKLYLYEKAWRKFEYERNRIYYDIAFSMIQAKRNLKPNPYLTDTARHLFATALGAAPGYIPAMDEEALPMNFIQHVFGGSYGLKKYIPTIMQPAHFDFEKHKTSIYYSLHHPATHVFSPKSREVSSTITEILELEYIMGIFCEELSREVNVCADTIIGKIAKNVVFNYFHNKSDRQQIIRESSAIPLTDARFGAAAKFASDAPFVRGCVAIQAKEEHSHNDKNATC